jgi:copper transport protein
MRPGRASAGALVRAAAGPLLLTAATAGLVAFAGPAQAHAVLVSADPRPGYTARSVSRVVLTFDEAVAVTGSSLTVTGASGRVATPVSIGTSRTARATLTTPLPDGAYTVAWQVTADDGDVVTGTFGFGVRSDLAAAGAISAPLVPARAPGTAGLAAAVVLRWLLFGGMSLALGGLVGDAILTRIQSDAGGRLPAWPRAPTGWPTAVGATSALLLAAHTAGQGSLLRGIVAGPAAWLGSAAGRISIAEVALFAVAGLLGARARHRRAAVLPLLAIAVAEGLRNHLHARWGWAGTAVIAVHLSAAAVWSGALITVIRGASRWRASRKNRAAWLAVYDYARVAAWLFAAVITTGTAAAIGLVGSLSALTGTGYGRALLVKLGLAATVTGLAGLSRLRLGTAPSRRPAPGRPTRAEATTLAGVLMATAVLVSVPTPADATAVVPPPPAPLGPVVSLGGLAGNITVGLAASAGLLRLKAAAPLTVAGTASTVRVKVSLVRDGRPERLSMTNCGGGCFAAPTTWRGTTQVRIDATAHGWRGGRAELDVPWPPAPAGQTLTRVFAAMTAMHTLTMREVVSSDGSRPPTVHNTFAMTGAQFLDVEPYGPDALGPVLVPEPGRRLRVVFAVTDTYYVDLLVDRAGRITTESLTTPNHLIRRTFTYPS